MRNNYTIKLQINIKYEWSQTMIMEQHSKFISKTK